ncbi:hypothetical protein AB0G35_24860 [Streptomyces sp. NPDC021749]|uniref:hypothetical protein n=1 Tax=Streptomyces sp. NPDC021749 TaxID=3154905 RepID=UPI0033EF8C09
MTTYRGSSSRSRTREDRVIGRTLVVIGVVWRLAVAAYGIGVFLPLVLAEGLSSWWTIIIDTLVLKVCLRLSDAGRRISRHGRRYLTPVIHSVADLSDDPFVLYLRPFAADPDGASMAQQPEVPWPPVGFITSGRTLEEQLGRLFREFGVLIAVGQPGEQLPYAGAHRIYLPLDDWQDTVRELMLRARLVVLVAGPGAGTIWEYLEAIRLLPPCRLLLAVYHGPEIYEAFRRLSATAFGQQQGALSSRRGASGLPPALPDYPEPTDSGTRDYPLKGVVHFDAEWGAHFLRFDPAKGSVIRSRAATSRVVRKALRPVLKAIRLDGATR